MPLAKDPTFLDKLFFDIIYLKILLINGKLCCNSQSIVGDIYSTIDNDKQVMTLC